MALSTRGYTHENGYTYNISVMYNGTNTGANKTFTLADKRTLMNWIVENGRMPTQAELQAMPIWDSTPGLSSPRFQDAEAYARALINNNKEYLGFTVDEDNKVSKTPQVDPTGHLIEEPSDSESYEAENINDVPRDVALDKYFNEWYSGKEGTTGTKVRGELENVFANKANTEMLLADAAFQQQALQQAQTVKSITDQVRAERMARLKSGMSESQIANQDMQMMMANVNALNDQAAVMNQGRLQAQADSMNAKDQAYLAYLEQAQGGAQTGAAYSAANAGDLGYQVINSLQRKYGNNWTKPQYDNEIKLWSGQANTNS